MATITQAQINIIRLKIDDKDHSDFSNSEIELFWDQDNSVNYVIYNLAEVLITRLRKQLLESDTSGEEVTKLADLRSRLKLLETVKEMYEDKYNAETNENSGVYISSTKPTIAGGDV
jgi:hypothetical protein